MSKPMGIVSYINTMNRLYGSEQQVAGNPLGFPEHMIHQYEGGQLTPEEFYQHQSIPQSERPLTGAEGGRVYDTRKYLQGGRVGMKPGGLVEPGVTHYGKYVRREGISALDFGKAQKVWTAQTLQSILTPSGKKEQSKSYKIIIQALEDA